MTANQASLSRHPSILLVSGEASGDQHGASLVTAFRALHPEMKFWGMGGSKLAAAGMEITFDARHTAGVNGFTEVLGKVAGLLRTMRAILERCDREPPTAAVLIDFPDFNLRLAKKLHQRGIKVFYFIAPQVWAWREGRVNAMRESITELATIIPFEVDYFRSHGITANYVGHPYLDRPPTSETRATFCDRHQLPATKHLVALLPGSRRSEVARHMAPMLEAIRHLRSSGINLHAVIPVPDTLDPHFVRQQCAESEGVRVIEGQSRELLTVADAAIVKSGTSTVDAALAGVPFCVIYKVSGLSFFIAKTLVRGVDSIAMANLIAGKQIVKEILQSEVTGPRLAQELSELLTNEQAREKMKQELQQIEKRLRQPITSSGTAGSRAAALLAKLIAV